MNIDEYNKNIINVINNSVVGKFNRSQARYLEYLIMKQGKNFLIYPNEQYIFILYGTFLITDNELYNGYQNFKVIVSEG